MIIREIIVTCSNPNVARAAVLSIGGEFARRVSREAAGRNLPSGQFAAKLVGEFARRAGDGEWERLDNAVRGADMPILAGLRHILERAARPKAEESARPPASAVWASTGLGCA